MFLLWVPFWVLVLGVPGGSKKGFLLFFFFGGGFFFVVAGVHVPRFCFSFLSPLFLGLVFLLFFLGFFVPFLPSGRGVVLFFFLPLLLGLVFVCFSFIFGWFFVVFSSLRGVFLLWVPFWACFGIPCLFKCGLCYVSVSVVLLSFSFLSCLSNSFFLVF